MEVQSGHTLRHLFLYSLAQLGKRSRKLYEVQFQVSPMQQKTGSSFILENKSR